MSYCPCLPAPEGSLAPGRQLGEIPLSGHARCPARPGNTQLRGILQVPGTAWAARLRKRFLLPPNHLPSPDPAHGQGLPPRGQPARPNWAIANLPLAMGVRGVQLPGSMLWDFLGSSLKPHLLLASRLHQTGGKSPFHPLKSLLSTPAWPRLGCSAGAVPTETWCGGSRAPTLPCPAVPCPAVSPSLPSCRGLLPSSAGCTP